MTSERPQSISDILRNLAKQTQKHPEHPHIHIVPMSDEESQALDELFGARIPIGDPLQQIDIGEGEFPVLLPSWAAAEAEPGVIQPMLQLITKDGHRSGNAVVAYIEVRLHIKDLAQQTMIHVVTDADSPMVLTIGELLDYYHLGDWIMKEFPNPKSTKRSWPGGTASDGLEG